MAKTKDDHSLRNRTNRAKLPKRKEPYWMPMEQGRALGYYRGEKVGKWIAKFYDRDAKPSRVTKALGSADDFSDSDGKMVLSFSQAQEAAREWFKVAFHEATGERVVQGGYTIRDAYLDYLEDRRRHGAKTAERMKWDFESRILPTLGTIPAAKLTKRRIEQWMEETANSPARHRGVEGAKPAKPEAIKARQATVNRLWTLLRAALNRAFKDKKIPTDAGWKTVSAFKGASQPRVRFLSVQEQQRLVNAANTPDFRRLLQAGLFTGAREGAISALKASDFDPQHGTVRIEASKSTKVRYAHLTEEGLQFFQECTAGLAPDDLIFPRTTYSRDFKKASGTWSRSEISKLMTSVCKDAKLDRLVFHELRHTYASSLINAGMPLVFVAAQLGHVNTRMVERHYGHLCQTAQAEALRKFAPALGIFKPDKISLLEIKEG